MKAHLMDIQAEVDIRLGKVRMSLADINKFTEGTVIIGDKSPGEPADIYINGTCVARGQVIVADGKLGVQITELESDKRGDE